MLASKEDAAYTGKNPPERLPNPTFEDISGTGGMMSSHSDSFVASGSSPTRREVIPSPPDFVLENHGSILLLRPQNQNAVNWLDENVGEENGFQPYWPTAVIEPRYVVPILAGITNDGLIVAEEN